MSAEHSHAEHDDHGHGGAEAPAAADHGAHGHGGHGGTEAPAAADHGAHGHGGHGGTEAPAADHGAHGHGGHGGAEAPAAADHGAHGHGGHGGAEAPAAADHGAHGHGGHGGAEASAHPHSSGGKSPIVVFRDWIFDKSSLVSTKTAEFGDAINGALRNGALPPVEKKSLLKTPLYAAGQIIDGIGLNIARRSMEIISPAVATIRSVVATTVGSILKPSSFSDGTMEKHADDAITSIGKLIKNSIMAIPRGIHDIADRAIDRPIQQLSTQIERVPLIGKLITSPFKWLSGKIKAGTSNVVNFFDTVTSPSKWKSSASAAHGDAHGGHDAHAAPAHGHAPAHAH